MFLGREQRFNPNYSKLERLYIRLLGIPILGLRIRARNIFALIPSGRTFRNILDAGSGTGVMSFGLGRKYPFAQILGIDVDPDTIAAGNRIAAAQGAANVRFACAAVEDFNAGQGFNLIICVDILEHIANDLSVLQNLNTLAADGGILVLHVPALYRRYPVWRKCLNFDVPTHVRSGYEPARIRSKVEEAGFAIISSGLTYGFWESLANNLSYMITRARMENRMLYALAFPGLNLLSLLGARARPRTLGAGVYVVAEKRK